MYHNANYRLYRFSFCLVMFLHFTMIEFGYHENGISLKVETVLTLDGSPPLL